MAEVGMQLVECDRSAASDADGVQRLRQGLNGTAETPLVTACFEV
jgi:hypothetical protein